MVRRRRHPLSPVNAEVRAILGQPWQVDAAILEGIASHAHEVAQLFDAFYLASGDRLAAQLGYEVAPSPLAPCGGGALFRSMLLARPSADPARWNLRVLHELAHALLVTERREHGEADAWALTLALAVPREAFRRRAEAQHVPRWAVTLRGYTARAVAHAA